MGDAPKLVFSDDQHALWTWRNLLIQAAFTGTTPSGVAVLRDHVESLCAAQGPDVDSATAACRATLVTATVRGLLLDLLSGGDRSRVERAAEHYLDGLAGAG